MLFVEVLLVTQPGWEPQLMGFDFCCQMMGQVIGLRVMTASEVHLVQLEFLNGALARRLGSVMGVET